MDSKHTQNMLRDLLGDSKVRVDGETLSSRSHDFWLLDFQRRLHGQPQEQPLCVVMAQSADDVVAVVRFAVENGIALVPYGAGSGVCGGARPGTEAIVLDVSRMNRLVSINEMALTVTVQPGMMGNQLEAALNQAGYSMGHFPQSINLSSVGGWVATRASGQFSTKYGGIEDMLVSLKGVLADGTLLETRNSPRTATGPSVNELMLGSEGTLAVLTELTFKIHPLPEKRAVRAFQFDSFAAGLNAIRLIMREGWKPALARLYDAAETKRHFAKEAARGTCVLLVLSEGPAALADAELAQCTRIAMAQGAVDIGEGPVRHWLEKRFNIPNLNELATEKGVVFDTIEVAANWDCIHAVYQDAVKRLKQIPGIVAASAHSSHSYQQGTCLYFTFAIKKPYWLWRQIARRVRLASFTQAEDLAAVEASYNAGWTAVMEATLANGGTISHHHGVGKVRMPWLRTELSLSYPVLAAVKAALDPKGVLNPGTLFPRKGGDNE